jgi:hypothetical protein
MGEQPTLKSSAFASCQAEGGRKAGRAHLNSSSSSGLSTTVKGRAMLYTKRANLTCRLSSSGLVILSAWPVLGGLPTRAPELEWRGGGSVPALMASRASLTSRSELASLAASSDCW